VVERRDDVLLYTTAVLSEDLTVAGSSRLRLYVRCDRADADFTVRLCDVFPDGRSIILTDAVQRARFREGTDREVFMRPGEVHAIEIRLQELAHTFRVGHRLRVVIGGSDYPRFDVNLNNGGAMYTAGDTLVARCEILHSTEWPSSLLLETPAATAAADIPPAPTGLRLHIPWPQPFAPGQQLNIRYDVPEGAVLHVEIRDLLGRHLRTLRRTAAIRGDTHAAATPVEGVVVWDGRDRHGVALSAGTYLITLTTGDAIVSRPVLLLR
jgi:hypothetical protein